MTGCAKKDAANATGGGTVSVYTAYGEDEAQFLFMAFEEQTGIKVKSIRLSAGELHARVQAESKNPQASVWFGSSVDILNLAARDGLIEAYTHKYISEVPENLRDPNGIWTPHTIGLLCYVTNNDWFKAKNKPLPTTWEEILTPEFKDQVVLAHPATSGMAYSWMIAVMTKFGEEDGFNYIKALDKNIFQYTKGSTACARMVGLGESAVSFVLSSDARNTQLSGYPVSISYIAEGTGFEIAGMALIKNGPAAERDNAKAFIDWVASKEAAELFVNKFNRLPANQNAVLPEGLVKPTELKLVPMNSPWATDNRVRLVNIFESEVRGKETAK
jgi:iron(III) transport system substrate-binding protein